MGLHELGVHIHDRTRDFGAKQLPLTVYASAPPDSSAVDLREWVPLSRRIAQVFEVPHGRQLALAVLGKRGEVVLTVRDEASLRLLLEQLATFGAADIVALNPLQVHAHAESLALESCEAEHLGLNFETAHLSSEQMTTQLKVLLYGSQTLALNARGAHASQPFDGRSGRSIAHTSTSSRIVPGVWARACSERMHAAPGWLLEYTLLLEQAAAVFYSDEYVVNPLCVVCPFESCGCQPRHLGHVCDVCNFLDHLRRVHKANPETSLSVAGSTCRAPIAGRRLWNSTLALERW